MIDLTNEGKITIAKEIIAQSKRSVFLINDKNLRKKTFAPTTSINT